MPDTKPTLKQKYPQLFRITLELRAPAGVTPELVEHVVKAHLGASYVVSVEPIEEKGEGNTKADSHGWIKVVDSMPNYDSSPNGKPKWYLVSDGKLEDVALLVQGKTFMGHILQFSDVTHWQNLLPLPVKE